MRALIVILVVVLVLLQGLYWFGAGGHRDAQRLAERVAEQQERNAELERRNIELQAEVDDLRERLEAIEERARSELGLVRDNEEFFQVVPAPDGAGESGG